MPRPQDVPLYNSRILDMYLKLVKRRYPFVNIEKIFAYSHIQSYEVADPGHWFTQTQADFFVEKLREETGNPDIAREAGKFIASPDAGWSIQTFAFGFFGCTKLFEVIEKITPKLTRSSSWRSEATGPNQVEIVVTPHPGVEEKLYQCESRIGYIEAIPLLVSNVTPTIKHTECIFSGGKCCRYEVTWPQPKSARLGKIRAYLTTFFLGMLAVGAFVSPQWTMGTGVPISLCLLLLFAVLIEKEDKKELTENMKRLRDAVEQLGEQVNVIYNNSMMTSELSKTINSRGKTPGEIIRVLTDNLKKMLKFDRGFVLLLSPDGRRLEYMGGYGYEEAQVDLLQKMNFVVGNSNPNEIFTRCLTEMKSFFLYGEDMGSSKTSYFFQKVGAKSMIACPLLHEDHAIGVLVVENRDPNRTLLQSDVNMLMGITPIIGLSITNAETIESRERQMTSILEALAATIDARDPLTAGHSNRVTEYAVGICEQMNMPRGFTEMVRVAALLHDYGKVGIPDVILKKNGHLTTEEFDVVKTHVGKTREILDRINFEGIFRQVPMVAEAHHEKMDGSGYPKGLKGKEIPMGARIIAVADFFEALNSKRHYREPMPQEEIIEMLRDGCDKHFDPRVVDAFLSYWRQLEAEKRRALEESNTPLVSKLLFLKEFISS